MKTYYQTKRLLKQARWQARRAAVSRRYGKQVLGSMPAVFGNAIPKSGSHLIDQVLRGLVEIGPFVNPGFPPVNRDEANRNLPEKAIVANLAQLQPGDLAYGYLHCKPPFIDLLTASGIVTVFIYRDPRDVAVSVVKYATGMHLGHGLHKHFTQTLTTDDERINFVIEGSGVEGLAYSSLRARYERFLGWLEQPVLSLRFEDLILDRDRMLGALLDYLAGYGFEPEMTREEAVAALAASIAPERSGTFRKGKPGGWKEHFTDSNIRTFKAHCGDLLLRLGYEKDEDW